MASIHMDIIHSCILPRLPVKSLTRFKSVSKTWQTMIASPKFIHLHYQHALSSDDNRLIVFLDRCLQMFHVHELDSPLAPSLNLDYTELGPIPVVILASSEFFLLINSYHKVGLIFLNPSTGRYYEIPYPPSRTRHPNGSYDECYGIYLDEANHDYKVVRIFRKLSMQSFVTIDTNIETMVYSLRDNMWRLIEPRFDKHYRVWRNGSAVIRHLLHIPLVPSSQDRLNIKKIGCFDILAEKWTNDVPFPQLNDLESIKLTVLDRLLCVTGFDCEENGSGNWSVWIMKEYGVKDSWFKLTSIAYNDILYPDCCPIAYRTGSRHELLCKRITNNECIWYNFRDKKATQTVLDSFNPKATVVGMDGYICKGSLVDFPGGRNMKLYQPKQEEETTTTCPLKTTCSEKKRKKHLTT